MNYWIFTAAPFASATESLAARQIFLRRMEDRFWGLGARTPNRRHVRAGDEVVFYVARPESAFAGITKLKSDSFALSPEEQERLSHGSEFYRSEYGVWLDDIAIWDRPKSVVALATQLDLIEDPRQWWAYLQGGIRQITDADWGRIVGGRAEPPASTVVDQTSQGLFALESHLEEFIAHNWPRISWGGNLRLYSEGDATGRQFPAGPWSIDFLAVDQASNELVVIELKRAKSSDAAVGQLLRYVNWVKENIAQSGQNVRGIIVASEVDDALRYAARDLPGISVKTYSVSFALEAAKI